MSSSPLLQHLAPTQVSAYNCPDRSFLRQCEAWCSTSISQQTSGAMIPHDMLSMRSLETVLVLLAGFVAWRVSLNELYNAQMCNVPCGRL